MERKDLDFNTMRIEDPILKFEKLDDESPWSAEYFCLWIGALKSFELNALDVFSNYDANQFARYSAEAGSYKLYAYTRYEDDPT